MKYILLIDTETTGLNPATSRCIEVACMLYDIEHACPVSSYASLIRAESNDAEPINKIKPAVLVDAPDYFRVWRDVAAFAERAECLVAHRAEFDKQFVSLNFSEDRQKPWVCTKSDILWPDGRRGDDLLHLALGLGLGVASAHRAMADVDTMARILTRVAEMGHPLEPMFLRALRPKARFVALLPYERRQKAKDAGFLWDADKREWYRHMPLEDVAALPFRTREG